MVAVSVLGGDDLFLCRLFSILLGEFLATAQAALEVGVVAEVARQLALADRPDPGGDLVDEVAVVGDEQDRAVEAGEHILQGLARVDVEVVRRLVQDQEIRLLQEEDRQGKPGALAAREGADGLEDIVLGEQEAAEVGPGRFLGHRLGLQDCRQRRPATVELLVRLGVVADFDVRAELAAAFQGMELAGDGAQAKWSYRCRSGR